ASYLLKSEVKITPGSRPQYCIASRRPTLMPSDPPSDALRTHLNTVKTHQRAVHRKLNVEHRHAAVGKARELGLPQDASNASGCDRVDELVNAGVVTGRG